MTSNPLVSVIIPTKNSEETIEARAMKFDSGLYKIGNPLSPQEKETSKANFPHVRILTWKGLVELAKFAGFRVERAVGSGHIFGRLGELTNKKNCRFITIKVRKMKVVERSVNEKWVSLWFLL